jgi:hypothetical protein
MEEVIKKFFSHEEHFVGEIKKDGIPFCEVTVDVSYNPFDTHNMRVRLTDFKLRNTFSPKDAGGGSRYTIEATETAAHIEIELSENSNFVLETSFPRGQANVSPASITRILRDSEVGSISRISWGFSFPLVRLIEYRGGRTKHPHRGFYRGWREGSGEGGSDERVRWADDMVEFEIEGFSIKIFDAMDFWDESTDEERFPYLLAARHSQLYIAIEGEGLSPELLEPKVDEIVQALFSFLSIVEHDWIRFYGKEVYATDPQKRLVEDKTIYIRVPEPRERRARPGPSDWNRNALCELLPLFISRYLNLDEKKKKVFDSVCRCFKLACYVEAVDISFLFWHSCLDFLKGILGHPGQPFGAKLVAACDGSNIDFEDLFPVPTRAELLDGHAPKRFRFTEIRNNYIHDGFIIEDFDELFTLRDKMRGLTERLLLRLLDIDYRQTPLGKERYY